MRIHINLICHNAMNNCTLQFDEILPANNKKLSSLVKCYQHHQQSHCAGMNREQVGFRQYFCYWEQLQSDYITSD